MSKKYYPKYWTDKYIKSATNRKSIKERTKRILATILIPVWLIGLCYGAYHFINGIMAIPNLKKAYSLKNEKENYWGDYDRRGYDERLSKEYYYKFGGYNRKYNLYYGFDYATWNKLFKDHDYYVDPYNNNLPELAIMVNRENFWRILYLPVIAFLLVGLPWLLLRLIFWIVDADKDKPLKEKADVTTN